METDSADGKGISPPESPSKRADSSLTDTSSAGGSRFSPPARLLVLLLTTFGFVVQMSLRVTMSVGVVAMVNHTAIPHVQTSHVAICQNSSVAPPAATAANASLEKTTPAGSGRPEDGEYLWDEFTQGLILSSFYWGYTVTQVPGGYFTERYGTKIVLGVSQGSNAALSLLIPSAAALGAPWVMVVRVLQGLACGVIYPCLYPTLGRWFPINERQMALGCINGFTAFGIVTTSACSGLVASSYGWRAIFYITGGVGLFWLACWVLLMHDTPADHPRISERERRLIAAGNATKRRTERRPPYLQMLLSPPVWAIVITECANSWALTYLLTSLPTYMKHILGFNIRANGLLSGLPLLGRGLAFCGGCGLLLLLVTFVGCQPAVATFFFFMAGFFNGFIGTGHLVNSLDIAPNYSGSLYGIANFLANAMAILNPIVTGAIIRGQQTMERWSIVFYLGCGIFFTALVLYQLMMSVERQTWDKQEDICDGNDYRVKSGVTNAVDVSLEEQRFDDGRGQESNGFSQPR
ncbi:sialin-like [Pollicipes pollicipes]|uniref:sialin-like n=1 Tax=Pollicipes pollicipes TaxID=41117 RepID=UPI00188548DE|nr:sialin-like [Pollicipes pollicipes]